MSFIEQGLVLDPITSTCHGGIPSNSEEVCNGGESDSHTRLEITSRAANDERKNDDRKNDDRDKDRRVARQANPDPTRRREEENRQASRGRQAHRSRARGKSRR